MSISPTTSLALFAKAAPVVTTVHRPSYYISFNTTDESAASDAALLCKHQGLRYALTNTNGRWYFSAFLKRKAK